MPRNCPAPRARLGSAWRAIIVTAVGGAAILVAQVPTTAPAWVPDAAHYQPEYFRGARYDESISTPTEILGFELGTRPATHAQIARCLETWARESDLTSVHPYGQTHERRELWYATITSEHNRTRLHAIRQAIGKLADPRKLRSDAEAERIIENTPTVAWLAYSIHGDELSGADAALACIHYLIADRRDDTRRLLDDIVIHIDPLQNPDGRDRWIRQIDEVRGYTPNYDTGAWQYRGRWPRGRGNHYLFDLNRDWILGVHPETVGRREAILHWNPQLLVDAHEMGANSTFLFTPPREPINPHLPSEVGKWWKVFADEHGEALDRHNWGYYSREWLEFWYPGYSDAWAAYLGAVGVLYEQARTAGHPIVQHSGSMLTYREAVHHQIVSTIANLETLQRHRGAVLRDFLAQKRAALEPTGPPGRTLLVVPSVNRSRERAFIENLVSQGIEVEVAQKRRFEVADVTSTLGARIEKKTFGAGTYVIRRAQPNGPLLAAMCDFDPRVTDEFLQVERRELEKHGRSKLYDITGWSLPLTYNMEAYWARGDVATETRPYEPWRMEPARVQRLEQVYAYVVDTRDDAAQKALVHLLANNVTVRSAEKPFRAAGMLLPPGSLLIRVHENGSDLRERLEEAVADTGVPIYATHTARSPDDTPDLGGEEFRLLERPRVALVGDSPVSTGSFGTAWHLLDCELRQPVSLLTVSQVLYGDLRRYNVIILPSLWGSTALGPLAEKLAGWVRDGGTLIALDHAAAWLADEERGLSAVRLRRDVLDELPAYEHAAARDRLAGTTEVDPVKIWDDPEELPTTLPSPATQPADKIRALEAWRRRFSPRGVIVRARLDPEHWLTYGHPEESPVFVSGSRVLMSRRPVETPIRLAAMRDLRLSGLLWPEAAARLAGSAYLTRERVGRGQVILFAQDPNFRGAWHGTRRLLLNAVLLGPGLGTSSPPPGQSRGGAAEGSGIR